LKVAKDHKVKGLLLHRTQIFINIKTLREAAQVALPSTELVSRCLRTGKSLRQVQRLQAHIAVGSEVLSAARSVRWSLLVRRWSLWREYAPLRKRLAAAPSVKPIDASKPEHDLKVLRLLAAEPVMRILVASCKESVAVIHYELLDLHNQLHELTKDAISCPKCGYQFIKE
jgi:hypothetical protein